MSNRLYSVLFPSTSAQRTASIFRLLRLHSTTSAKNDDSKRSTMKDKTPKGKLDDTPHPDAEKEPLKPWPNNINPHTGEIGGPSGPEPTRYGDWERKGKCVDF